MMFFTCIIVVFFLRSVNKSSAKINPLPYSNIKNYLEGRLSTYDLFDNRQIRSKRSLANSEQIFRLTVFNRTFLLYLAPTSATSVSSNLTVSVIDPTTGNRTNVNSSEFLTNFFSGNVIGDPSSTVTGYLFNNQFVGTIYTGSGEVFNIESLSMLTGNMSDTRLLGYYDHHMRDSPGTEPGTCGYKKEGKYPIDSLQQPPSSHSRHRRSTDDRLVCTIQVVADYAYFSRMGNEQLGVAVRSVVKHLDDVNQVFAATNLTNEFTKKPMPHLQFELASLIIMTQASKPEANRFVHFNAPFKDTTVFDSSLHLRSFGDSDHNKLSFRPYCLNHLFTYRRMKENVLGLAFLGVICSKQKLSPDYVAKRGPVAKNIGLTTHMDTHGYPLLFRRATLVAAHELGHNCGSDHDPKGKIECMPDSVDGGAFLMNPISVLGYAKNNDKFSPCTVKQMSQFLTYNSYCLVKPDGTLCGNHRLDPSEECDAGLAGDECCTPTCKLKPGAACSHANSPCCKKCKLAAKGSVCYDQAILLPCIEPRHCDGVSPACAKPAPLPDGTECNNGIGRCHSGDCRSVCHPNRLCDCPDRKDSCYLCCGDASKSCAPFYQADGVTKLFLPPKSDCFAVGGASGGHCLNGFCSPKVLRYSGRPAVRLFQAGSRAGNSLIFIVLLIGTMLYATGSILWRYHIRSTPAADVEFDELNITIEAMH